MQFAPRGFGSFARAIPVWLKEKLFLKDVIQKKTGQENILFCKHHESHAASAFYPSPFKESAIITLDGVGEWDTLTIGRGMSNKIEILKSIGFPHSLGLLYSAFTYFTGFRVNSGEYKLMGLASYGKPKYASKIYDHLIDVREDGSFRLNLEYFNFHTGLTMTNRKFNRLFGDKPRHKGISIRELDIDMAASIQLVFSEIVEKIVRFTKKEIGGDNLVLAGGSALNCVTNGAILKKGIYKDIWIQPAAGDAGGALGAALYAWHQHLDKPRRISESPDGQSGSFLGPRYSVETIRSFLESNNINYQEVDSNHIPDRIAELIEDQKVIGIYQGRMEFGPRALGHRSIIGDARSPAMQKKMNIKIKFRESFRPFAPSILEEEVSNYFDFNYPSRYMLLVYNVLKNKRVKIIREAEGLDKLSIPRSEVPAITHVDFSARVHSVDRATNPFYYSIIKAFYDRTGCGVIINTSFNVRGEPIVNTPDDAYNCFKNTNMDYLLLENFLIEKTDYQDIDEEWVKSFPPD
jgi:carbamoyltransferase